MFGAEAIFIAVLILLIFRMRSKFGLTPLYIILGVFQPIQVLLASSIYVEVLPDLMVSPGSIVMFTASLFAILLIYIREGSLEARKVIYGIFVANLTMTLLMYIFGLQIGFPRTLNFLSLPQALFNHSARVMLSGTIALFFDVLLIIFVYEWMSRFETRYPFLRIYLTMCIILIVDTVVFATGAFWGQANIKSIIQAGIMGKLSMAVFYAGALSLYLRYWEVKDGSIIATKKTEDDEIPFKDIFYALTYRDKYEIEYERGKREWEATFESISDWICITDDAGKIIRSNRAGVQFTNIQINEMIGKTVPEIIFRDETNYQWPFKVITKDNPKLSDEFYFKSKNIWWEITAELTANMANKMNSIIYFIRDISKQKEADKAFREEQRRLKDIIDITHLGDWYWDVKSGDVTWSPEVYQIFGLDQDGFTPQIDSIMALSPWEEENKRDQELIDKAVSSHEKGEYEQKFIKSDGTIGYYYSTFLGIYDTDDSLIAIRGTVQDITERKAAENELLMSESKFKRLMESTPFPLCYVDSNGIMTFRNKRFVKIFGYDENDVPGLKEWWMKAYPDEEYRTWVVQNWENAVRNAAETNTDIESEEYRVTCKDGSERDIIISGITVNEDFLVTFIEITERKKAEQTLKQSAHEWQSTFDATNDGIWILDLDHKIIRSNKAATRLYGHFMNNCIDKHCYTVAHDKDKPISGCPFNLMMKSLEREVIEFTREDMTYLVTVDPIFDDKNMLIGGVHNVRDITKRKKYEAELKIHRDHLEELVKERTAELVEKNEQLEQFNKLFIGREFRIKELKEKLKNLENLENKLN